MELVGRMLDGTISYTDRGALEPVPSASSINQSDAPADTILIRAGERGKEICLR